MASTKPSILTRDDGAAIAFHHIPGKASPHLPGVIFCGGFKSDMTGNKATFLQSLCEARGQQYTRFDYFGHGQSSGAFTDGTIGRWRADTLCVLDEVTHGPQIVVGSSMGGWMACHAAVARPDRVAGLILIAPAVDFTMALMWPNLPADARRDIEEKGVWYRPSIYDDGPYPITKRLIDESRDHLLLDNGIPFSGSVRIFLGLEDETIPLAHVVRTIEAISSDVVSMTAVKAGNHRLSTTADLERLRSAIDELSRLQGRP